MNIIEQLEGEQVAKLLKERPVPDFGPGDTVRIKVMVVEGSRERIQIFEGVCIARRNAGLNSSFTVRKISYGEGVERIFPLYSPRISEIEVVRRGRVRRAKLYYLRSLRGRRARIAERTTGRRPADVLRAQDVATADEAYALQEVAAEPVAAESAETSDGVGEPAPSEQDSETKNKA